jgi:hypothetical protein
MTSSDASPSKLHCWHHSNHFALFSSQIAYQYLAGANVHPSSCLALVRIHSEYRTS